MDVQIIQGSKVIEVRNSGVNKGTLVDFLLGGNNYDFVLAAGDDITDEDMFKALPENSYSIKVGITASHAKYNLQNFMGVRKLLEELING
jgi:trehalose 6-phosphate synthase/phosphatase